ncbi:uncharacterized protein EDB91DRAFT_1080773 [Suillus paluster]|uniref:uncharacterized protein n=1 Tax=Suillus paluster TaxID=48578 RepID=UPI001B86092D|nr:uncharacterized protein EDB91DRAFT_1080773 [Suillus paluster]KAG1744686.1 hypothetical protein EDB91DRAFT_1080773 [Suillus paluster]
MAAAIVFNNNSTAVVNVSITNFMEPAGSVPGMEFLAVDPGTQRIWLRTLVQTCTVFRGALPEINVIEPGGNDAIDIHVIIDANGFGFVMPHYSAPNEMRTYSIPPGHSCPWYRCLLFGICNIAVAVSDV